jgi:hypothetical protein
MNCESCGDWKKLRWMGEESRINMVGTRMLLPNATQTHAQSYDVKQTKPPFKSGSEAQPTLRSTSWQAESSSAAQETPRFLWNQKFITVFTEAHNWTLHLINGTTHPDILLLQEGWRWSCPCALTTHHAMQAYWGSGGIAPCILNLGTRWRWVVSFTSQQLYPRYPLHRDNFTFTLAGIEPQSSSPCSRHYTDWAIPALDDTLLKDIKGNFWGTQTSRHRLESTVCTTETYT